MSLERMDVKIRKSAREASSSSAFISHRDDLDARPEPGSSRLSASPASISAVDDKITAVKKLLASDARRRPSLQPRVVPLPVHRRELEPIIIPIGSRHALLGQLGSDATRRNRIDSHATVGPFPGQ